MPNNSFKGKLLVGMSVSGMVLSLTLPTHANLAEEAPSVDSSSLPLSSRAAILREKIDALQLDQHGGDSKLKNIVQFFNFFNCMRPGWRNC